MRPRRRRRPNYSETWQYGKPDLILTVERPFTLAASGTDVFRNFVLPYPLQQTHYIRAMEIRPGAPQIVHHANILIDRTASFRRTHPAQWKDGVPGMELELDTPEKNLIPTVTFCSGSQILRSWLSRRACHGDSIPAMT